MLRDIIKAGDVVTFINNVIVGTETEEEYNNIVEKVLRRMVENDLFVKLEKYVWNIKEVVFFRVVIRPDKVYIEREKI